MAEFPLALVTGAAHRLGRAFTLSLARQGYAILLHYHQGMQDAYAAADEIRALDRPVFLQPADLTPLRDRYRSVLDAVTDPEVARELVAGPAVPGGRIRRVAILFCDIRGFTALTERRGAEEVVGLLNRHMEAMCEEIRRHGGVVDKFVGDLVMATFGTVREAADDARRAAACAVAMQRSRAALNAADATPIQVGVGVSFGDVVADCMGGSRRLDYTVVGERVNLASRLCGAARAGEVVVDDATRAALPAEWPAEALPPMQVKGFSQPVLAFRLPVDSAP